MTIPKHYLRLLFTAVLIAATGLAPLAKPIAAQQKNQDGSSPAPALSASLTAIEQAIDAKRKELGIPGASLVIVKDDKVIYLKGFGMKDIEHQQPVTPDTQFAIGSASKAFTALTAVMAVDEGKLSLDDSPKKYLPYFKMRDPDTDAKITIRDLLSHRSGLNRTDLAMVTGKLNRAELIQVAGMAKPTAKLGEKFQYQNIMYTAAGEAVAQAEHSTWDDLVATKIFRSLGMKNSNTTIAAMQQARDFSFGYDYNPNTKETRKLPMREIPAAAPAGAINSSARDMSQWLRFLLAGGSIDGRRLVSEKGFAELFTKQINIAGSVDYGLGWFLRDWNGHKVVEHGGNIDGFNAQVALMPDQKLGFVLLTNVTASPLGGLAMQTVWKNLVPVGDGRSGPIAAGSAVDPKEEVGTYRLTEAGVDFDVAIKDGKLTLTVPGQPPYPLENLGGRRYKLADPAPPGFFATFRPIAGKEGETEMFLEQPQGNVVVPRARTNGSATAESNNPGEYTGPLKELIGFYESESKTVIEIGLRNGKIALLVPGQPPYSLIEKTKDKLSSPNLPDSYSVNVSRDNAGKVSGIVVNQPEGKFPFHRLAGSSINITVDELIKKVITAMGGEENLRRHKSSETLVDIDFESQGVTATGTISARAPALSSTAITLKALGKEIGSIFDYFDGSSGGQLTTFSPEEVFTGKGLADAKRESDFYGPLNWKQNYQTITITRTTKVGDEDAYLMDLTPDKGNRVSVYISTKSFLPIRVDSLLSNETLGQALPRTSLLSDYRLVDGQMVPFKNVTSDIANGDVVIRVKDVKFNVEIPDSRFKKHPM